MFWVQDHSHPWLNEIMSIITFGGDAVTLIGVSGMLACFFIIRYRREREAIRIMLLLGIGYLLTAILKYVFHRERPNLWEFIARPEDYGFPSGHALISVIVYGNAAILLAAVFPQYRWHLRVAAGILVFLIGASRVYLGVHWPSDVVAGFVAGLIVVFITAYWYSRDRA